MSASEAQDRYRAWSIANQQCLEAELGLLRVQLHGAHEAELAVAEEKLTAARAGLTAPSALDRLVAACGLSPFERSLVLLCAGDELHGGFIAETGTAHASATPTFGAALARLPGGHWSALTPAAPLRSWRILEPAAGQPLARAPLHLDERILHFLLGLSELDERLTPFLELVELPEALPPTYERQVEVLQRTWMQTAETFPVVQLCGRDVWPARAVAAQSAAATGRILWALDVSSLPRDPAERAALQRLWERECLLGSVALFLETETGDHDVPADRVRRWVKRPLAPIVVGTREPLRDLPGEVLRIDLGKPSTAEQSALWRAALGSSGEELNGEVDALTVQFDLGVPAIRAIARQTLSEAPGVTSSKAIGETLWENCRRQARVKLDDLAERIEIRATWDDLVLPVRTLEPLRALATQARQRARVYETWGLAKKSARGLGLSAMFHGPSGTGKTLAAEILAREMGLDLYRIDLSQVVSKYIGETEKNLARVFNAAEEGGAVLLFDEADALFGKRSEVKDSHDRYANIEVSYLLQRMENYRGLAILTTNRKEALDQAFLRRLRFIIAFPFPDAALRAGIWKRMYPVDTPTDDLRVDRLAQLNATGGMIRNIALGAAFLAADADEPVRMRHLREAARAEFAKNEKSLPAAETEDWV